MPPPLRGPPRGVWGRRRAAEEHVDPLEAYGLPSKGETRLSDFKTQERYYGQIVERYLQFCTDADGRDGLLQRFASLELGERAARPTSGSVATAAAAATAATIPVMPTTASVAALAAASQDLTAVLAALRKLREAIVATDRADEFATQAYLFCIRLAILARHPQSYHPALLHLLRHIHAHRRPLRRVELQEVAAYRVLDAACRRADLAEAFALRRLYGVRCATVDAALRALARDDWVALRRLLPAAEASPSAPTAPAAPASTASRPVVDAHHVKLLEYAVHDVRVHTLKCFGRAYLRLEHVSFLEASTGLAWPELQRQYAVGWERDADAVIIRKVPARKLPPATAAAATAVAAG